MSHEPVDPLVATHRAALDRVVGLSRQWDEIVATAEGSNADDEHDPEGATIAFERQQVAALLAQARASAAAAVAAIAARDNGSYGMCQRCGDAIGAERLEARPSAVTCISCARRERVRR